MFEKEKFSWTGKPENCRISDDRIEIVTEPETDLWQRTFYNFSIDNSPLLQMKTSENCFSFTVRAEFEGKRQYDQCGIVMHFDADNWLKISMECDEGIKNLGSVATNYGYSDWATTAVDASINVMWYRLTRKGADFSIECSQDGKDFMLMRVCHMFAAGDEISFGLYACSPQDSSFIAVFTDMDIKILSEKDFD